LSDYLKGEVDIENLLLNPGIPRLTILPSGRSLPDSDVFLGSLKMENLICEMKTRYSTERIIIFDSSSFLSNADSLILSKHVDAVLLVVENEKTEEKALLRTIEMLEDNTKIIGTVMNKTR
jgi:non-specific protein-tyrosine kinase